ncbi:hypothetical protein BASA60_009558 [Batrachochytrium salamandrivorans]|nr:hypothetical protein BASA60_009558 [Batrachochytrium salamandrivorans]
MLLSSVHGKLEVLLPQHAYRSRNTGTQRVRRPPGAAAQRAHRHQVQLLEGAIRELEDRYQKNKMRLTAYNTP